MLALSGWDGLIKTHTSSGTMAEGINSIADIPLRNHSVPEPMLARLAGAASQPTGRLTVVSRRAAAQIR